MADEKRKYAVNGDELYKRYYSTTAPEPSLTGLYEQITRRPAFSYDVGSDPLYQQYRDRYVQQGKDAMRDTMGQAAALTGGYGNSYAQGVGQQTYDRYMQGLTDKIPEMYSAAYSRYQDEGNRLMQQYSMAKDVESTAYSRQQSAYQRLYSLIGSTGYQPTDEELAAAGMPREIANRIRTLALLKNDTLNYIDANGNYVPPVVEAAPATYGGGWGGGSGGKGNATGSGTTYSASAAKNIVMNSSTPQEAAQKLVASGMLDQMSEKESESFVKMLNGSTLGRNKGKAMAYAQQYIKENW